MLLSAKLFLKCNTSYSKNQSYVLGYIKYFKATAQVNFEVGGFLFTFFQMDGCLLGCLVFVQVLVCCFF